jgi:two-component system NarL family response regulator
MTRETNSLAPEPNGHQAGPVRTLIVDDFAATLDTLCAFLGGQPGFLVVGTARDGEEALTQADALRPDLVLMDLAMPKLNGLEVTQRIRERWPRMAVIIVSVHDGPTWRAAGQKCGARGFVSKDRAHDELAQELRRVLACHGPTPDLP